MQTHEYRIIYTDAAGKTVRKDFVQKNFWEAVKTAAWIAHDPGVTILAIRQRKEDQA